MADIYTKLTDQIVAALEQGTQPWFQPWKGGSIAARPLRHNGQPYSGINVIRLWMESDEKGYVSPTWMTYKQAQELGGQVRKGEKSTIVVYSSRVTKTDDQGEDQSFNMLKTYLVFNCDQIDGLPEKYYPKAPAPSADEIKQRNQDADAYFDNLGITLRHGGNRAYYSPSGDYVQLPNFEDFNSADDYYCTKGHEAIHWTKPESRENRSFDSKRWGDEGYAIEELVAELGSVFLAADLGIAATPRADHASYIANWLQVLKNDKRAIFTAASHAERAVKYLHKLQPAASQEAVD